MKPDAGLGALRFKTAFYGCTICGAAVFLLGPFPARARL